MDMTTKIENCILELHKQLGAYIGEVDNIDPTNLHGLLTAFRRMRDIKKDIDMALAIVKTAYSRLDTERVPQVMQTIGLDKASAGGYNFSLGIDFFASIPAEKVDTGFKWLKENGMEDLIKEGVNAKSLSSRIKSHISLTGISPPEDAISMHTKSTVGIRKST